MKNTKLMLMILLLVALSSQLMAQSVTRTSWEMNRGAGWSELGFTLTSHGEVNAYNNANIPVATDVNWEPAPNPETIGFSELSQIPSGYCLDAVDYTYFQTYVSVPTGSAVTEFTIAFSGIDDGGRVSIFNSAYPSGLVVPGSYVYLSTSNTADLAAYVVEGQNRVVVTQVDDCPTGNNLQSATVVLNGETIAVAPTEQTVTVLGAVGTVGDTDPYIQALPEGATEWSQAYLTGSHPWGLVTGTNSWLNFDPSDEVGLNTRTPYRIRFVVPDDFTDPSISFDVKADNRAVIWINDTFIDSIESQGTHVVTSDVAGPALHTGVNEIRITMVDWGGIVGINYRIDITLTSEEDITGAVLTPADAAAINNAPVADAGPDQTVTTSSVTLDASGSSDVDGNLLIYTWSLNGADIATGVNPTVTLGHGQHTITLTATDGELSDTDDVVVDVTLPPMAASTPDPADDAADVALDYQISWAASDYATGYLLTIGGGGPGTTDIFNEFDLVIGTDAVVSDGVVTFTHDPTWHVYSAEYFWTVVPYNSAGSASGSVEWSYTTMADPLPVVALDPNPVDEATDVNLDHQLSWSESPTATGYLLSIGTSAGATDIFNEFDLVMGTDATISNEVVTFTHDPTWHEYSTDYYWTVVPYNANGSANGAMEWSYTTMASPMVEQTFTIYGANGVQGDIDPYTQALPEGATAWQQAFLTGPHVWGEIPGTNSWVNFDPDPTVGLNTRTPYRIRFNVPEDYSDPSMVFQVKADNRAIVWINDTYIDSIDGEGGASNIDIADATVESALHVGLNEIRITMVDWGGAVGLNYRIDVTMTSAEDISDAVLTPDDAALLNNAPIADAGPDQTDMTGTVTLDGSGSSDPDGNLLIYTWSENGAELATGMNPTVMLGNGLHAITLTVSDGELTDTDEVLVDVSLPTGGETCDDPLQAYAGLNSASGANQWFEYTATMDGTILISSDGTEHDTRLFVYDACEGNQIAYNDDIGFPNYASEVSFASTAGMNYLILWDDLYGPGPFDWVLEETAGPTLLPDFVVSAMWSFEDTVFATVTNQGTADSEGFLGNGTDYHKWSIDGTLTGGYATGPALAMGASATFALPGFTYGNFGVGMFDVAFHADIDNDTEELDEENNVEHFEMYIDPPPPVPQNLIAEGGNALINVTWEPAPMLFRAGSRSSGIAQVANQKLEAKVRGSREPQLKIRSGAFREAGDTCIEAIPAAVGLNFATGADEWFEFTAIADGMITISSDGTDQDTRLYVYDACDGLEVAYNDDIDLGGSNYASEVTFSAMAGVSYKILWDDLYGPGPFDWFIEEAIGPTPMPDFMVMEMWSYEDTVFAAVANIGTADSEGYLGNGIDYHSWSIDGVMEPGYVTGPALAMGATAVFHIAGLSQETLGSGIFDIALHADVDNDTDELDEGNNVGVFQLVLDGQDYIPSFTLYRDGAEFASGITELFYLDMDVMMDTEYCYTVTQQFEDMSESGHSNEDCATPEAPVLGDLCSDPIPLMLPVMGEMGSSFGFNNDYEVSSYMSGVDIVYSFSVPEDGSISGNIADGGGEWSAMFVMDACPDMDGEVIAMGSGTSGGSFEHMPIMAGDYFLIVSNWPTPDDFTYTFDLMFEVGPVPTFELLSPVADMMVTTLTPDFFWESCMQDGDITAMLAEAEMDKNKIDEDRTADDAVQDIVSYSLYLGTDPALTGVTPVEVMGSVYTPAEELMENQVYYWAVSALDDTGLEIFSDTTSFWTNAMVEAPEAFALVAPEAGEELTGLMPVFTWNTSTDPDIGDEVAYTLIVGTSLFDLDTVSSLMDTSYTFGWAFEDNSTYHWMVYAEDNTGVMTASSGGYQEFTLNMGNDDPSMVDLISPDSVQVLTLSPEMYWTPAVDADPNDQVSYEMHWWGEGVEFDSVLTDTNAVVLPRELADNAQYFWEVLSMDDHGGISHSEVKTFWTDLIPEAPMGFALLSPANNSTEMPATPTFSWEVAVDPDPFDYATYTLQIASDSNFTAIAFEVNTEDNVEFTLTEALPVDAEYWWRVVATDTDELSTESEAYKITVGTVSVVADLALPTEYVLDQNFPNPFNPSTTIRYGIPEDATVSLIIYDVRGNVVRTLESGTQTAGWYEQVWDGRSNDGKTISTGLYMARIVAGNYSEVIKMLYLK